MPPPDSTVPLTTVGVLGDIHAEDGALEVALRYFQDVRVDAILSVGDVVDGMGCVERCCELLCEERVAVVQGNHERWFFGGTMRNLPDATQDLGAEARRYLASLPRTRRFETAVGSLLLCHGLGDEDMGRISPDDDEHMLEWNPPLRALLGDDGPDIVINGHTHRRLVWSYKNLTVINAGTLFREHNPCFLIVDFAARELSYFDLDDKGRVREGETRPLPRAHYEWE